MTRSRWRHCRPAKYSYKAARTSNTPLIAATQTSLNIWFITLSEPFPNVILSFLPTPVQSFQVPLNHLRKIQGRKIRKTRATRYTPSTRKKPSICYPLDIFFKSSKFTRNGAGISSKIPETAIPSGVKLAHPSIRSFLPCHPRSPSQNQYVLLRWSVRSRVRNHCSPRSLLTTLLTTCACCFFVNLGMYCLCLCRRRTVGRFRYRLLVSLHCPA